MNEKVGSFQIPLEMRKRYKDVVPLAYLKVSCRNLLATDTLSNPNRSKEYRVLGFIVIFKTPRKGYQAWTRGGVLEQLPSSSKGLFEPGRIPLSAAKKRMLQIRGPLSRKYKGTQWKFEYDGPLDEKDWPEDFKRAVLLEEV